MWWIKKINFLDRVKHSDVKITIQKKLKENNMVIDQIVNLYTIINISDMTVIYETLLCDGSRFKVYGGK